MMRIGKYVRHSTSEFILSLFLAHKTALMKQENVRVRGVCMFSLTSI